MEVCGREQAQCRCRAVVLFLVYSDVSRLEAFRVSDALYPAEEFAVVAGGPYEVSGYRVQMVRWGYCLVGCVDGYPQSVSAVHEGRERTHSDWVVD